MIKKILAPPILVPNCLLFCDRLCNNIQFLLFARELTDMQSQLEEEKTQSEEKETRLLETERQLRQCNYDNTLLKVQMDAKEKHLKKAKKELLK